MIPSEALAPFHLAIRSKNLPLFWYAGTRFSAVEITNRIKPLSCRVPRNEIAVSGNAAIFGSRAPPERGFLCL